MRAFGRFLGRALLALVVLAGGLWLGFAPRPADLSAPVPADLPADLDAHLAAANAAVPDLRPGAEERIVWAGAAGARTPLAVVYLHGYSAGPEEIRPVPDEVAGALGANLLFIRLAGHGRPGAAMAEARAEHWVADTARAMALARRLGERVVIIGTSTGGTLAALAAVDPALSEGLAGVALISPNFAINSPAAAILDLPLAEHWGPLVAGATRSFTPANAGQAAHWTTEYPTAALFPLAALLRATRGVDFAAARTPALFVYARADRVVDPAATDAVRAAWGGPVTWQDWAPLPGDDPNAHVIAGAILSPGGTAPMVRLITDWARGL
jgi:alpha-beta hydrolase superfamily lysophospholipase